MVVGVEGLGGGLVGAWGVEARLRKEKKIAEWGDVGAGMGLK